MLLLEWSLIQTEAPGRIPEGVPFDERSEEGEGGIAPAQKLYLIIII